MRHIPAVLLFVLLCLLIVVLSCWGKPAPADKKTDPVPSFAFASNWGAIQSETVKGKHLVTITGHPMWDATGVIRKRDGKWEVFVEWTTTDATPRHGIGLYAIDDKKELTGFWNWIENCEEEPDGTIKGLTISDRVYRVKVD